MNIKKILFTLSLITNQVFYGATTSAQVTSERALEFTGKCKVFNDYEEISCNRLVLTGMLNKYTESLNFHFIDSKNKGLFFQTTKKTIKFGDNVYYQVLAIIKEDDGNLELLDGKIEGVCALLSTNKVTYCSATLDGKEIIGRLESE
jgi:hypothetical protein